MRKLLWVVLGLLGLLGGTISIALWQFDGERLRPVLERTLGDSLGRTVQIDGLELEALRLRLRASGLRIADVPEAGGEAFIEAESVILSARLWPLLSQGALQIDALQLMAPRVRLIELAPGRWNASSLGGSGDAPALSEPDTDPPSGTPADDKLSLDRLLLEKGSLLLQRHGLAPREYRGLRIEAEGLAKGRRFPLRLSAELPANGSLRLQGELGPLADDPLRSPLSATLTLGALDLAASGLVDAGSALRGVVDVELALQAEDGVLQTEGELVARGLRLLGDGPVSALPLGLRLRSRYALDSRRGELEQASLEVGGARLALSGRFAHPGQSLQVDLRLQGEQMPVDDLQALLPAFGVLLPADSQLAGGEMDLALRLDGPLDALRVAGPISLRDSRLEGYSLGAQLAALSALAGLPAPADTLIRRASLRLERNPQTLGLEQIDAEIAELGSLQGGGTIDSEGRIDMALRLKLDAELAAAAGGGALAGSGLGRVTGGALRYAARSGLGLKVSGDIATPSFSIERRSLAGSLISGLLSGKDEEQQDAPDQPERSREDQAGALLFELLRQRGERKQDDDG